MAGVADCVCFRWLLRLCLLAAAQQQQQQQPAGKCIMCITTR